MSALLFITGASRGLGRSFSIALTQKYFEKYAGKHALTIVLLARSDEGLRETERQVYASFGAEHGHRQQLHIERHCIDLSNLETLDAELDYILKNIRRELSSEETSETGGGNEVYDEAILINNAGSLGDLQTISTLPSLQSMQSAINFNVTSACWLTSKFMKHFSSGGSNSNAKSKTTIVNISSLCAVQAFKTCGVYCAGKAARDMFHATLAAENKNVRVLNYAPGPCDTDMQTNMRESETIDGDIKAFFRKSKDEGTIVVPMQSAQCLSKLVFGDFDFESGSHVDYFDFCSST
eukprot:CAMPEP_0116039940 /NCGR_PEP_ID=MMETSP0321-20121206/23985_1 /TAXON_ID=163516 /ORGANISM="Leptocylindrus danicus var. danicus, Strain B650" /LENGTH=293 /DNA_ID=CAMNT_0003519505 /DNA_START=25 /DNA_END=909 /DNA_ORIENTATION=-